jgi:hypothetical protein
VAYWVDDGIDTWPETIRAGKAAMGLYVCCGAWIARNIWNGAITEPVVPVGIATMYGTQEWVTKLVDAGLWVAEGTGYRDVRYHQMGNPAAEKVTARRVADAARKARWRDKNHESRRDKTRDSTRDSDVSHSVGPRVSPRFPALPPLKGEGQGAAPASQARAAPAPTPSDPPRFTDGSPVGEDPYDRARWEAEDQARADEHIRREQEQRDTVRRGAAAVRAALNGVRSPTAQERP